MQPQPTLRSAPPARGDRSPGSSRPLAPHATRLAVLLVLAVATSGCATHYQFDIESIRQSNPAVPQLSYRLVDARPDSRTGDALFERVAGDVRTALSSRGLYAAPAGTTPHLIIEVDYGISAPVVKRGVRQEPVYLEMPGSIYGGTSSRESGRTRVTQPHLLGMADVPFEITTYQKFLRLTARENEPVTDGATPRQVWSVLVTNEDGSDKLPVYTRLMVAAAMDHIGADVPDERRVVLTREGRMDEMEVLVEAQPAHADAPARQAAAGELAHHIKSLIGISAKVSVADPGGVERSQGKARRVVDKRPK